MERTNQVFLSPHSVLWEVLDGEDPLSQGTCHNEVLSSGLDQVGIYGFLGLARYAVVGTGKGEITSKTEFLPGELVRTARDRKGEEGKVSVERVGSGYQIKVEREFREEEVGGKTLTCWGFAPSGSSEVPMSFANLFRNSSGEPEPLTLDGDQRLRLTYTYRVNIRGRRFSEFPFTLPGGREVKATFDFVSSGNALRDLEVLDSLIRGEALFDGVGVWLYGDRDLTHALAMVFPPFDEVGGARRRKTGLVVFPPEAGAGEIWALGFGGKGYGFIVYLPEPVYKTDLQRLYIEPFSVSWAVS